MPLEMKVKAEILDVVEIRKLPDRMTVFSGQEMSRHAKRFRKRFIKERLSGSPGIKFARGKKVGDRVRSVGRNVTSFKEGGQDFDSLKVRSRLSRFLSIHETGGTVRPKKSDFLYIRKNKKRGQPRSAEIVAKVRSVTIKPRLGFNAMWDEMEPDLINRITKAVDRALNRSFRKNKRVGA